MSGIFGFSVNEHTETASWVCGLDKWNSCYGCDAYEVFVADSFAIGNHQEHLNDQFCASAPVIHRKGITAVIDAVIYNRSDLLCSLNRDEDINISDEDLLLDYLEAKGFDALETVNGDFAGAVYRHSTKEWTLFRDHSGVRPLYYYKDTCFFAFSTDIRGLTSLSHLDLSINEELLYLRMMGFNNLSLCGTDYEHIQCVRPASYLCISSKDNRYDSTEHIYWEWGKNKIRYRSDAEYQAELRRLITDAIKRRLDAFQGKVGCELSGGLDSSVIAIIINRLGREGCFYSWSFDVDRIPLKDGKDERKVISDICSQENISCTYYKMREQEPVEDMFSKVDPAFINTRYIGYGSEFMHSQNVKVVFSGHGGDEGVSHRCNLFELWYHREYLDFFRILYRQTNKSNMRILRTLKNALHQIFVVNKDIKRPFYKQHTNSSRFLNAEFVGRMMHRIQPRSLTFAYDPIAYILQGGHRPRLDNIAVQGAENGVRYMVPFIDYRVLDFALSIPRSQYHNGYTNRYIYRHAFKDIMPESLLNVHYKHAPSMVGFRFDVDVHDYFYRSKDTLLEHLNRDWWKDYLNFDAIENFHFSKDYTEEEYNLTAVMLDDLTKCGAIQNLVQKSAEWGIVDD